MLQPLNDEELTLLYQVWDAGANHIKGDIDVKAEGGCYWLYIGGARVCEFRKAHGVLASAVMLALGFTPRLADEVCALRDQMSILAGVLLEHYRDELGKDVEVDGEVVTETMAETVARLLREPKERRIITL